MRTFVGRQVLYRNRMPNTMEIDKYTDREIVEAILCKDAFVTKEYLYKKCYPLFKAIHSKYYTECENVAELINEIYLYILTPHRLTGRCKLADFGFRCSLFMWLKIVSEHFCYNLYGKKIVIFENFLVDGDRISYIDRSLDSEFNSLNMDDVKRIVSMMPNARYRHLIELRYLDEKSNEETATLMSLTMTNYYNMHLRAKAQLCSVLRKEGLL